ncbi:hypothetical protein SAMN05421805_110129 [Saccharopolyspora antimicrobica]|uniref:Uncharacterized protein n=1 Tax=Saccharopolyspora antimicrobica TaxID=455193 RepID=A0A1I5F150_9PSEU|nr:hypothetical protein ATL45_1923 [Saccharopolyspora antimicrobica]SFO17380.1 hypothetical protein SAMN05421805_110129 [Saccharopolyspora antimicrobica]
MLRSVMFAQLVLLPTRSRTFSRAATRIGVVPSTADQRAPSSSTRFGTYGRLSTCPHQPWMRCADAWQPHATTCRRSVSYPGRSTGRPFRARSSYEHCTALHPRNPATGALTSGNCFTFEPWRAMSHPPSHHRRTRRPRTTQARPAPVQSPTIQLLHETGSAPIAQACRRRPPARARRQRHRGPQRTQQQRRQSGSSAAATPKMHSPSSGSSQRCSAHQKAPHVSCTFGGMASTCWRGHWYKYSARLANTAMFFSLRWR